MQEAQYNKVFGSHLMIDNLLNRANREERDLTEDEFKLLEENAKNILEELIGFDALKITENITIHLDSEKIPQNIATPMDVFLREEELGEYIPNRE